MCASEALEAVHQVFEDLGPGGVLHLLGSEDRGHERTLAPHEPAGFDGVRASGVEGVALEEVHGDVLPALGTHGLESLELALVELESEAADSGGSVEVDGVGFLGGAGVEGTVVRSPHPAGDEHGVDEGLGVLSDGGESGLAAADAHGVVLADVLAGGEVQLVGGDDDGGSESGPGADPLDGVSGGVSEQGQDAEGLLGGGHDDLLVADDVLDLHVESLLGPRVDDQSGGGERVEEDPRQREGVCRGLGLVGHEEQHGLGTPLDEGHLGGSGSGSLDVAGERVGQDVLSGGVQLHGFGDLGGLLEALPGGSVDILVALALVVGHEEVDVVSHAGDVEVLDDSLLLGVREDVLGGLQHLGVGPGVADHGSDVRLDDRHGDFIVHTDLWKRSAMNGTVSCLVVIEIGKLLLRPGEILIRCLFEPYSRQITILLYAFAVAIGTTHAALELAIP